MAELDLSSLEKKYDHFTVPVFYIKVGSGNLEGDIIIERIIVDITGGYEASSCDFEISSKQIHYLGDGGVSTHKVLDKLLVVGNKVEVKMGYINASNTTLVFKGYITSVEFSLDGEEGFRYRVQCLDVKIFMMNSLRSELKKDVKKYSDAVSGVLKNYKSMMDGDSVADTPEITMPVEQHRQSDYDFVVDLARRLNYMFYVVCGKVYFESYTQNTDSQLTIYPGRYLYKFRREVSLNKQIAAVKVRTNNEQDPGKAIEAKATTVPTVGDGSKTGKETSKLIGDFMTKTIIDNSVTTQQEAQARAEAELLKASLEFVTGEMEMVGLPGLVPGKFITVEDINDTFDHKYFITRVEHKIDESGFKTRCEFGVNKA